LTAPQVYFALVLYSYALHLRRGSYRALPHSRSAAPTSQGAVYAALAAEDALGLGAGDDDDEQPVFRLPAARHARTASAPRTLAAQMETGLAGEDVLFDEEDDDARRGAV
jgi:hypothetical protein